MRLLPCQQRANARGRIASVRADHFLPARAAIALSRGGLTRDRQETLVEAEAFFKKRKTIPRREMDAVPPVHFEVEFSIPGVVKQPGLLRRQRTGAMDRRVVKRKDDAPLQFFRARIGAAAQINCAAVVPEIFP